jgi:hypothetical protein
MLSTIRGEVVGIRNVLSENRFAEARLHRHDGSLVSSPFRFIVPR